MSAPSAMTYVAVLLIALTAAVTPARAQQTRPRPMVAADVDLSTITLVRSTDSAAVVRAGGQLHKLVIGDRVGRTAATVREVTANRLVLDEETKAADGTPQRVQIILREGETGGRRFTRQSASRPPTALRPEVAAPSNRSDSKPKKGPGPPA
jgi:hypothetical protein